MAYAYVRIYHLGTMIRKFGGNNKEVRELIEAYKKDIKPKELKDWKFEFVKKG